MSDIKDSPDNYFSTPSDMWGEYETYQTIPACGMAKAPPSATSWTCFKYIMSLVGEDITSPNSPTALWSKDRRRVFEARQVIKAAQEYIDKLSEEQDIDEVMDVAAEKKHDSKFMNLRVYLAEKKLKEDPGNEIALSVIERFGPKS